MMYYVIGAAFCIGFVVGMAYGIAKTKRELLTELRKNPGDLQRQEQRRKKD